MFNTLQIWELNVKLLIKIFVFIPIKNQCKLPIIHINYISSGWCWRLAPISRTSPIALAMFQANCEYPLQETLKTQGPFHSGFDQLCPLAMPSWVLSPVLSPALVAMPSESRCSVLPFGLHSKAATEAQESLRHPRRFGSAVGMRPRWLMLNVWSCWQILGNWKDVSLFRPLRPTFG